MSEQDDARQKPGGKQEDALVLLSLVLQQLDVQDPVLVSVVSFRLFSEKPGDVELKKEMTAWAAMIRANSFVHGAGI